jgi:hypothetical protein
MAHGEPVRNLVRAAYIHDHLPLEQAASRAGVAVGTAARWKKRALAAGDDWDKLRGAAMLAGEGIEAVARRMLADYIVQHKTLMERIAAEEIDAAARVSMLASLADSFNKTVAASRRVLPETNELAVALEVLSLLGSFVRDQFPDLAPAFLEIVEPFGVLVSQHFGKARA